MIDRKIDGEKHKVLLIPGLLLSEAARAKIQTGGGQRKTGWEDGGIHPAEQGQYAYGCLIFTFISGKDPHGIAYKTGSDQNDEKWIWDQVWQLYNKRPQGKALP